MFGTSDDSKTEEATRRKVPVGTPKRTPQPPTRFTGCGGR